MIEEFARRHIPFAHWFNVRDLGGYVAGGATVAWKRLYRAGTPAWLSEADVVQARGLGVATIIDLRREEEAARDKVRAHELLGAARHRLPIVTADEPMEALVAAGISAERYLTYLETGREAFREIFEVLGDPASYPVIVHCTAGKDRTGVVSAMTLEMLGVPRANIETDYAMTNIERERAVAYWQVRGGWFATATPELVDYALGVPPDAIAGFLDGLQARYGGAEAYLRGLGVPTASISGLRAVLSGATG